MTEETKDGVILGIGGSLAALLVKLASGWMQRLRKEPLVLGQQNIEWAKDMMTRLERQIDALTARVVELEREIEAERRVRMDCEGKYRELLGRMWTLTKKIEGEPS